MSSQIITPSSVNCDLRYKKVLELRKKISSEKELAEKFNTRIILAHKSNLKLIAKDQSIADDLNLYEKTFDAEGASAERHEENSKRFKEENKKILNEQKIDIIEEILNLKDKFLNSYDEYDIKNLSASIEEYRKESLKKHDDLKDVYQVEEFWRDKIRSIWKNPNNEKITDCVHKLISNENCKISKDFRLLERDVRDLRIKWQQYEEAIQEISNHYKCKYTF